jgi:hypothetical protein
VRELAAAEVSRWPRATDVAPRGEWGRTWIDVRGAHRARTSAKASRTCTRAASCTAT